MSGHQDISAKELATVVHDVRQMLAVITGRAGLLRKGADNRLISRNLEAIEEAAIQAGAILSRLRLPAGNTISEGCDIFQTLQRAAILMEPEPGVPWKQGNPPHPPQPGSWYLGGNLSEGSFTTVPEPILLEVLNNLLINALGVMPGGGSFQVDLERDAEHWIFRLQDSGPGIPADQQDKIFEMGFSSSGDPQRGIGLSASRDLIQLHGGSLALGATDQPGACFEIRLPHAASLSRDQVELSTSDESPFQPTVLVVDDERSVREMLKDVLVELGCEVKVARDAPAATEIFPTETFEMVIIDQNLPGMSGLEFAEGLRREDPNLVLVLISGWGQEEILDKARGSVVDLVGEKPITVDRIMEILKLAGALRRHRLEGS